MTTTLTATAEPANGWTRLEVVTDAADATWVTILRDGVFVRWARVAQLIEGTDLTVVDAEAPYDELATYEATVIDSLGVDIESDTDTATLTDDGQDRLISLAGPALVVPITVTEFRQVTTESRNGVFPIIGRRAAVAVTDARSGESGTLSVLVEDRGEWLREALAEGALIAFRTPTDRGYGTPMVYSVGQVTTSRIGTAGDQGRVVSMAVTEVEAPAVTSADSSPISWAALVDTFATWQDVLDAYDSWYEVVTVPVSDL